jgi:ankyrin repeat protein
VRETQLIQELCQAAHDGDLDLIKLLAKSEANLNGQNFDGRTVGHLAVAQNQIDIIEYLAQCKKCSFNIKDRWGKTALDLIKWSDQMSNPQRTGLLSLVKSPMMTV